MGRIAQPLTMAGFVGETQLASGATVDLGSAITNKVEITGTTTITSLGTVKNLFRLVRFAAALTLTRNATTLELPTQANITTAAGDWAWFVSDTSGNWRCIEYQRASGASLDTTVAKTGVAAEWTKQQNFNLTTLTDAANISWDLDSNQVAEVTLAGNRTLDNPTNLKDGAIYILRVIQDPTGSRTLSFGSVYKFPDGTAPTMSTGANAVDYLTFICDGTNMHGVSRLNFS